MNLAGAAAGAIADYVVGGKIEGSLTNTINPWYRPQWVDIGVGVSKFVAPGGITSMFGTAGANLTSKTVSAGVGNIPSYLPKKNELSIREKRESVSELSTDLFSWPRDLGRL